MLRTHLLASSLHLRLLPRGIPLPDILDVLFVFLPFIIPPFLDFFLLVCNVLQEHIILLTGVLCNNRG